MVDVPQPAQLQPHLPIPRQRLQRVQQLRQPQECRMPQHTRTTIPASPRSSVSTCTWLKSHAVFATAGASPTNTPSNGFPTTIATAVTPSTTASPRCPHRSPRTSTPEAMAAPTHSGSATRNTTREANRSASPARQRIRAAPPVAVPASRRCVGRRTGGGLGTEIGCRERELIARHVPAAARWIRKRTKRITSLRSRHRAPVPANRTPS